MAAKEIEEHVAEVVRDALAEHVRAESENFNSLMREVQEMRKEFLSAFPNGDPKGHEEFHRDAIAVIRDLSGMMREVRNKTVVGVVWSVLGLLAAALWFYVKSKLGAS